MIYLLLGEDRDAQDRKIAAIRSKRLTTASAVKLDFENLDGSKLDPAELKKTLTTLPAVAKMRVVLIRHIDKFNDRNKSVLLEFAERDHSHADVICCSVVSTAKNAFLKKLASVAEVSTFGSRAAKNNVFDMTRAMEGRDTARALKLLHELVAEGDHPLKIMGALVWFWGKIRNRLTREGFKKGLLVLQEADLNIKRSRLDPQYAVEVAVTRLTSLIAG